MYGRESSQEPPAESNGGVPECAGDDARHLLALVTALQTEPLTESQQVVVTELQQGLATLAESLNEIPK